MLNKNKILLIEPGYRNKYPPLGLMKIAQYHGAMGKGDHVRFVKGEDDTSVLSEHWDRIYVTSLFSFEYTRISKSIDFALAVSGNMPDKIFVGGIAVSLMPNMFSGEPRWRGIRFIKGLLDMSPALSLKLQMDPFDQELYAEDTSGLSIEDHVPDYSILDQIDYKYPVSDAYFAYASRGCTRKCSFCGVPKLEGELRETASLSRIISGIEDLYGTKKDLMLMDNNVVASSKFEDIIAEIIDLGFGAGARLTRNNRQVKRRVDFNQGVDARILCKSEKFLKSLSRICIKPLRIAFDHVGLTKPYESSIRYAYAAGITELSNYMLYNFHDSPEDLYQRMQLNVNLNTELGIHIYSFPMRYQPTDQIDRKHIGKKWNSYWLRSIQLILHATHGVVSGYPDFFQRAFGEDFLEFEKIISMPHKYIFHRNWYSQYGGKQEYDGFMEQFLKLSKTDKEELFELLGAKKSSALQELLVSSKSRKFRMLSKYYKTLSHEELIAIEAHTKNMKSPIVTNIPKDELVEDAGLDDPILGEPPG